MSGLVELNESNFSKTISGNNVVLTDFWAPWCGPCKMLAPILAQISEEIGDKVVMAKVNVDESPRLAQQFGVRSIPAIFIFKNGETVKQFIGLQDKNTLLAAIKEQL